MAAHGELTETAVTANGRRLTLNVAEIIDSLRQAALAPDRPVHVDGGWLLH
ncbi:hypothetical protein ABZ667_41475 [Streptomyces lavendulae]|uniref:hypothetical protein n=1 Tax=Streptomyces lavendulae TaxID=1914 RepID=UPI0034103B4E